MEPEDQSQTLLEAVSEAYAEHRPLALGGGNTKAFYGRLIEGHPLDSSGHRGIVHYEPTELVMTARSGTLLTEIEHCLAESRQMLPFEPPHFGPAATLGGAVAAGLSGPRRPYAGAVRDNVLGVEIVNGKGQRLRFGGEVMKNVAGYDVSRLMVGSLGTLGLLLQVSLKVLPRPLREVTVAQTLDVEQAIIRMSEWARQPLPVSATWYDGHDLYVRLSGGERSIQAAARSIGGDPIDWNEMFWTNVQEQSQAFFFDDTPLWRIAVPPATPPLNLPGESVMEWNGALRWLKTDADANEIWRSTMDVGGHATLFRGGDHKNDVFQPLPAPLMKIHKNLKTAFDPHGIFNPARMYRDL
jgi:glycolate oxidase FAD binding subunit